MSYKMIAMIPARLGSKRIPKKNLRYLGEKPLIQYPIDLAKQIEEFDSIWVNTESEELGREVEKMGAKFHKRPAEFSADNCTNREFTYHFMCNHECDYVIMVNSTSPLLRIETIHRFIKFVNDNDYDTVLSTVSEKAESFYRGEPLNFDLKNKVNSQMLEPVEKTVWALTAWKRESFMKLEQEGICPVFGGKLATFPIPKDESCDLDTEEDWHIAEGAIKARTLQLKSEPRYLELR
jgi:CMP-N-acetylneuraminic acid synthetase